MVVAAYGLPDLSILELSFMFNQLNITYGVVKQNQLIKVDRDNTTKFKPVIFDSASTYTRNSSKFKSKVIAFVVDSHLVLSKELQLPVLSVHPTKYESTSLTLKSLEQLVSTDYGSVPAIEATRQRYDPVPAILKSYNSSVLSTLQTQLYRIKDTEARGAVNLLVRTYLTGRGTLGAVQEKIAQAAGTKLGETFAALLATPEMRTLREVVHKAKANPNKIKTLSKKHKVSPFDVKYILATRN